MKSLRLLAKRVKGSALRAISDRDLHFRNVEGDAAYFFSLRAKAKPPGSSALIRSKNEATKIERCIRSVYDVFDEIVYVDNGSTDASLRVVTRLKDEIDGTDKIRIFEYPHAIARCGAEHARTDPDSLHSLVHYYNWCLSRVTLDVVVKWDADMLLAAGGRDAFGAFLTGLQGSETLALIPVQTVYFDRNGVVHAPDDEINSELRIFPNRPYVRFHKAESWEILRSSVHIPRTRYPGVHVYELKDTREDEFSHWTDTNFRTPRKQREWTNFNLVRRGATSEGFTEVDLT